jgi:hypothetical protein
MSDSFGLGDGPRDLSSVGALADTQVADARRGAPHLVDQGRWPGATTVVRVLIAAFVAIVVLGWIVTALQGAS